MNDVMPNQHTGIYKGRLYYKGCEWLGPSNVLGRKPLIMISKGDKIMGYGITTQRPTVDPKPVEVSEAAE